MGIDGHVREMEAPSRQVGRIEAPGRVQPIGWLDPFAAQADEILSFYDACHPIALARRTHTKKSYGGSRDLFPAAR